MFPSSLTEIEHLKRLLLKLPYKFSPFWSRQRTEGNNIQKTEVPISWEIIVISSLRTSTYPFPFYLCWHTKFTINVCQIEFMSLWCKRGNFFRICPSDFDVSLSRVWKWFPGKILFKEWSFISRYNVTAWRPHSSVISMAFSLSFLNHHVSVRKVSELH